LKCKKGGINLLSDTYNVSRKQIKGDVSMKYLLSNGIWATKIEDFEDVMEWNDYRALYNMMNDTTKLEVSDAKYWQEAYKEEELHSDALYSQNMSAYNEIEDLITYLLEAKRMNKAKVLDMLREIQNTLQNY
jgi:hypothetical protein